MLFNNFQSLELFRALFEKIVGGPVVPPLYVFDKKSLDHYQLRLSKSKRFAQCDNFPQTQATTIDIRLDNNTKFRVTYSLDEAAILWLVHF